MPRKGKLKVRIYKDDKGRRFVKIKGVRYFLKPHVTKAKLEDFIMNKVRQFFPDVKKSPSQLDEIKTILLSNLGSQQIQTQRELENIQDAQRQKATDTESGEKAKARAKYLAPDKYQVINSNNTIASLRDELKRRNIKPPGGITRLKKPELIELILEADELQEEEKKEQEPSKVPSIPDVYPARKVKEPNKDPPIIPDTSKDILEIHPPNSVTVHIPAFGEKAFTRVFHLRNIDRQLKNLNNEESLIHESDEIDPDPNSIIELDNIKEERQKLENEWRKITNLTEQEYDDQYGSGRKRNDEDGLSNFEIDKIMNKFPEFLGTISHDEIPTLDVKPQSRGCFIINTDPANKPGQHWQAIYFDARPNGENEIDFFDSYGDSPDVRLLKDIKVLAEFLDAKLYLKLKENRVRIQNNTSGNCGWFCIQFLMDRLRGKSFADASGYNDHIKNNSIKGEANIEHFKTQQGFGFLPSFRTEYPTKFKNFLTDDPIVSIQCARKPINRAVSSLINIVTLGGWNKALKSQGYDAAVHLYMVINGNKTFEKNHVIEGRNGGVEPGSEVIDIPVNGITIRELFDKTAEKEGPSLQLYNAVNNNCQVFLTKVLKANNLLTPEANAWINQNIEEVFKRLPWWAEKVSVAATNAAHKADILINGRGEPLLPDLIN